jgi:hypothetical protein
VQPPQQQQQQQQQLPPLLVPALQFDFVVVDEAGQGLAPEVLLPLSLAKLTVRQGRGSRVTKTFRV